jgi:dTDP-4-dehydrorhamnose reductase
MKTKVILTGATGMVGEGVLFECLSNPDVEKVLVIGRHSCGVTHDKLEEALFHVRGSIVSGKERR